MVETLVETRGNVRNRGCGRVGAWFGQAHSTFAEGTRGHFHVSCCCRGDADNAAQQREQCIGTAKVQPR